MVPFDTETGIIEHSLTKHYFIKCPSYEELEPNLNEWVKKHNKELIETAHSTGIPISDFKVEFENYLKSEAVQSYFENERIMLFGKSISAIDLPFLNRDLGWEWMNNQFHHRNQDLSCYTMGLIDMGLMQKGMDSGAELMKLLKMGDVCHTALEDAINTAKMYLILLEKFSPKTK